jgi:2-dehydropantoate 2-reductase
VISYFVPIRLAFGVAFGPDEIQDLRGIFLEAELEAEGIASDNVKNMEFSKLFTNLLGASSSSYGLTIEEGFADKKVFEEEIESLREYARTVKKSGGRFLNLHHYPTRLYTWLLGSAPGPLLSLFRKRIARAITKGRGSKEKGNIDEIDYYNGAVVRMGEQLDVDTPVNRKIYQAMKARMR